MTTNPTAEAGTGTRFEDLPALMGLMTGDEKHGPAATSTLVALWVLYDRVLRVAPETADAQDRDRFLLSKGHGPMAYYAVLAAKGGVGRRPGTELGRHLPPLGAAAEPPGHALELLPKPLGVRSEPPDRQIGIDQLPLLVRQLPARHDQPFYRALLSGEGRTRRLIATSHS